MDPPFLDLAFYVGADGLSAALAEVSKETSATDGGGPLNLTRLPGGAEILTRPGTLIVQTEGKAFCGPMRGDTARLTRLGQLIYEAFKNAADGLDCLYAAILVEYTLETPQDLRRDSRSLAFQDFYLSRRKLPVSLIASILSTLPPGTYQEELDRGIYISTSASFNPKGLAIESETAQWASARIGGLIARGLR